MYSMSDPTRSIPDFEQALPPIGSTAFFPALLNLLRNKPSCPPLDPSILQSILLCVLAGDKHLILRTNEADVGSVAKVAASTLATVFAYSTHRLKIRPPPPSPPDPQGFLRSLFLPYVYHSISDDGPGRKHPPSQTKTWSYTRSYSYPNDLSYVTSQLSVPAAKSFIGLDAGLSSSTSSNFPHRRHHSASTSTSLKTSAPSPRARTHQTETVLRDSDETGTKPGLELPRALVVSGLEHAGMAAQRALIQALAEKRVLLENDADGEQGGTSRAKSWAPTGRNYNEKGKSKVKDEDSLDLETGLWNLPDGFIIVYVCPLDSRERPVIHKTLLDRFAMSITISLSPDLRHGIHSTSFSRPIARRTSSVPTLFGLGSSQSPGTSHFLSQIQEPLLPHSLLGTCRIYYNHVYMTPKLSLYMSDLFSAARHHQQMDGTLLTVRARGDANSLIRACRVIGLGGEVVAPLTARPPGQKGQKSVTDHKGKNEILQTGEGETNHLASSFSENDRRLVLDVSEADIAKMVPRVISHRLRVLDSPEDQVHATAFFGAFQADRDKPGEMFEGWERSTVKDILAEILSEV